MGEESAVRATSLQELDIKLDIKKRVHVDSEAVESLPSQDILSEGSFSSEPLAAVSPGELTDRKREAVRQSKGGVVSDGAQELLPNLLLDLPQVGCLAY